MDTFIARQQEDVRYFENFFNVISYMTEPKRLTVWMTY